MKIAFRADASTAIGSGHVMRCLALADGLRSHGAEILFVCREQAGQLSDLLESRQCSVARLPPPQEEDGVSQTIPASDAAETLLALQDWSADWLVVDHYGIAAKWEKPLRVAARNLMVIDDLANRRHDCDLLLDQNYYPNADHRYQRLVPPHCQVLLGPRFALLREEFAQARKGLRQRDGQVRRLLVFFGGSDPTDETSKAISALRSLDLSGIRIDVVVGSGNPQQDRIRRLCGELPECHYHCQVSNMAELCAGADLALGAGGSAIWERACLELPSLVVITADNQKETTDALSDSGMLWNLGWHDQVSAADIANAVKLALADPVRLLAMARRAGAMMTHPGHAGGVEAVVRTMLSTGR